MLEGIQQPTSIVEALQLFLDKVQLLKEEGEGTGSGYSDGIAEKNIIPGGGSTFTRNKEKLKANLTSVENRRVYLIGLGLAKAFWDFNQTKKIDVKGKTLIQEKKDKVGSLGSLKDKIKSPERDKKSSLYERIKKGILDTLWLLFLRRFRIPKFSWPKIPKFSWPKIPKFSWPKIPKFSWPKIAIPNLGFLKNLRLLKPVLGALGTLGALGKLGPALGVLGKISSKVLLPLSLALDAGTSIFKLSSKAGRDELRKTAESLDWKNSFWGTLKNTLLNPIETITSVGVATTDLIDSFNRAGKAKESLDKAEEKFLDKLSKFDFDKSGKIDTLEEKLEYWKSDQDNVKGNYRFYSDEGGETWKYNKELNRFESKDGNIVFSEEEFRSKVSKKLSPEPEPAKDRVEVNVLANLPEPTEILPTPTLTPAPKSTEVVAITPSPVPVSTEVVTKIVPLPPPSVKEKVLTNPQPNTVDVNLDEQNGLIINQNIILAELLAVNKMQLDTAKKTKNSSMQPSSTNVMVNSSNVRGNSIESVDRDSRLTYLKSPYTFNPT